MLLGLGAQFWVYDQLQRAFPDADVLRTHLPGNHSPRPARGQRRHVHNAALSNALADGFPGRVTLIVGISTGALTALACPPDAAAAMVLVEPFLRTAHIPELRLMFDAMAEAADADFFWSAFGIAAGRSEDRTLFASPGPAERARRGAGRRSGADRRPGLPSLVDAQDRATLAAHPKIRVTQVDGAGHNVGRHNMRAVVDAIRTARGRMA